MSVDFLLLDKKDCVIQGSVPVKHIDQFKEYIREGEVFLISNFDVVRSSGRFKMTDHEYMVRFKEETTMQQVEGNHSIQHEKFRNRNFEHLVYLVDKSQELPDVIGIICNIPNLDDNIHGSSKRVELGLLLEGGVKVRVTIWDQMVDVFYDKFSKTNDDFIVMIVTSVNPKKFGRDLYLNTTLSTRFYLNYDFEIVQQFRERKLNFGAKLK